MAERRPLKPRALKGASQSTLTRFATFYWSWIKSEQHRGAMGITIILIFSFGSVVYDILADRWSNLLVAIMIASLVVLFIRFKYSRWRENGDASFKFGGFR